MRQTSASKAINTLVTIYYLAEAMVVSHAALLYVGHYIESRTSCVVCSW